MADKDDIVQITDPNHHWYPCLIVVSEPKSWGIQGYLCAPKDNHGNVGTYFIRLSNGAFEPVGRAIVVDMDEEMQP